MGPREARTRWASPMTGSATPFLDGYAGNDKVCVA